MWNRRWTLAEDEVLRDMWLNNSSGNEIADAILALFGTFKDAHGVYQRVRRLGLPTKTKEQLGDVQRAAMARYNERCTLRVKPRQRRQIDG